MQTASQSSFKSGDKAPHSKARAGTIAAIHITWKKLRPDLRHDAEALREQRLAFMAGVLKRPVDSSRGLTDRQLGRVLDAMRDLERAPCLPGAQTDYAMCRSQVAADQSEIRNPKSAIVHLATEAQAGAIDKLFAHLRWSPEAIESFIFKRFHRKSHRTLSPKAANSLTMILLNIAAARAIKDRTNGQRVTRQMIGAEIPAIKRLLGIDQRPPKAFAEEE